ncbi:MAG: Gfo/Idh/MocA family oxidoreductase [Candidatus Brockarchaeota archaeon]|nr:Gfo/Idh/MocA family oxidoreductase [Candidatus Brockarchaeota archaeon]
MERLKVGLVGANRGSSYGRIFKAHPRTRVTAVCDIDFKRGKEVAEELGIGEGSIFTDYDGFLDKADIDIVFIGTPMPFHAEEAIKALDRDKHVLSEVTAATSLDECERLFEAAKRSKAKYMMAENCCYYNFIRGWRTTIERGELGNVYYMEAEYLHEIRDLLYNRSTGETYWRMNRPPLHYCSHSLGPLLTFLGGDYVVRATGSGRRADIVPNLGPGAINMQVGLFETKNGVTIKILRSSVYAGPYQLNYVVYGTKGFLESRAEDGKIYIEGRDAEPRGIKWPISDPEAPEEASRGGHGTSEYYLVRDFVDSIDEDKRPPIDIVKSLEITVPGIIAHEAAMRGNVWLDVPHFG